MTGPAPTTRAAAQPTIYFIRHGETDWNAEARLQGQRDTPLNAVGRAQADEAASRLAALVPDPAGLAYLASPLSRTRETAAILLRTLGLAAAGCRFDARLKELSFGAWEGLTWREVRARDASAAAARDRNRWAFVPPGGESYEELVVRVGPVFDAVSRDTVVVSHGGVARALLVLRAGLTAALAPRTDIWQGRILIVEGGRHRWA